MQSKLLLSSKSTVNIPSVIVDNTDTTSETVVANQSNVKSNKLGLVFEELKKSISTLKIQKKRNTRVENKN